MVDFTEVAERVWVARQPWFDLNVTAIGCERGLVVVDTHASARAARAVIEDLRRLNAGEVIAVVNTHVHFDHTFGNDTFAAEYGEIPFHAHESVPEDLPDHAERILATYAADPDEHGPEIAESTPMAPNQLFSSVQVLDLGDRVIELVHPGRGHTRGDLVVRVEDADVLIAGDLIEESAPPAMGVDCWPMDWPLTLDLALGLTTPATTIVPGHGAVVDSDFVQQQRAELGFIAETIRDLASRGVPASQALEQGEWPWEADLLRNAVQRGYEHLPRSQKRLPLV